MGFEGGTGRCPGNADSGRKAANRLREHGNPRREGWRAKPNAMFRGSARSIAFDDRFGPDDGPGVRDGIAFAAEERSFLVFKGGHVQISDKFYFFWAVALKNV